MEEIFTIIPAKITKIQNNICDIELMYIMQYLNEEGEWADLELPKISNVPMVMIGTEEYFINIPHKAGDKVLCMLLNRDFSEYFNSDGNKKIKNNFFLANDFNFCIVLPFFYYKQGLPNNSNEFFSIEKRDGNVKLIVGKNNEIIFKTNKTKAGDENANIPVAKGDITKSNFETIQNWINTSLFTALAPLVAYGYVPPTPIMLNTGVESGQLFISD